MTDSKTPEWVKEAVRSLKLHKYFVHSEGAEGHVSQALLSAYERGMAEREWQPIETAPKDGSRFLAYGSYVYLGDTDPTEYCEVAAYSGDDYWPWEDAEGRHGPDFYSHWSPLPAPPAKENDNER